MTYENKLKRRGLRSLKFDSRGFGSSGQEYVFQVAPYSIGGFVDTDRDLMGALIEERLLVCLTGMQCLIL